MIEFNQDFYKQLCDLIKYDNAVLFLGQDYQAAFGEKNYFVEEINKRLCQNEATELSYVNLWAQMSAKSNSEKIAGKRPVLDDSQKNGLAEIGAQIGQNEKLTDALKMGWASIVTSSIDPGIVNCEGLNCNPIYNVNTRPAGIANKRKLHVTYMFGCVTEAGSYPVSYKIKGSAMDDASLMYQRVLEEAIPYSGALVIDGWNPSSDWASIDAILGTSNLDADIPYPKVFIFHCTPEIQEQICESDRTEELADSDKLIVSEKGLYECLEDYIIALRQEREEEQEAMQDAEEISFQRGKKTITLRVPREQLWELGTDNIHLMKPQDHIPVAFDEEGLRKLTINFLANSNGSFPYWQGYLHGCYFERDAYENQQQTGIYGRVLSVLQAPNLHKVKNTIILHGPSNSGKTILLGKLALDLSKSCPVLYINRELESNDPEITKHRYQSIVTFINTYLTRNVQTNAKVRAVVIWDNDVFVDRLQKYLEFANALVESNTILVGSAYELRDVSSDFDMHKKEVEYIEISPTLNPTTEIPRLECMLAKCLGPEYKNTFARVRGSSAYHGNAANLIHDENRILSLIRRIFRVSNDEYVPITDEIVSRVNRETDGISELMSAQFEKIIDKALRNYSTDISGLAEILATCTEETQKDEEWYQQLSKCAPTLNDILAMAGQFGIRLPLNLVKKVLCDPEICPDIKKYMDAVDEILSFDTMLEYPFPVDEVGNTLVGYRSPDEADIYLDSHFTSRNVPDMNIRYDNDGKEFLEDREIYLLKKIIKHSDLADYSHSNWHTVITVKELIDQFGPSSRKGEKFAIRFKNYYDQIATCILDHGGSKNPEMALCAAFLKREQIVDSMLDKFKFNFNISEDERKVLDDAAAGLEEAIKIEMDENNGNTARMMRIYVEWCSNRNYILNREKPSINDLVLFEQIHNRFSKALNIYQKQDVHRMKPMSMMDVYLNGFSYYVDAMERLYHVYSRSDNADPNKMGMYTDEIAYAMTNVLGKLLDFNDMTDYKMNLNRNIMKVYSLSKNAISSLQTKTRAQGSSAYIFLYARNLWVKEQDNIEGNTIQDIKKTDLYLISDYADRPGTLPTHVVDTARKVYEYLTQPANLQVIMSKQATEKKEVGALEMLIRTTWIVKTGNMPFTHNQFPKLSKADWDEMHKYCKAYVDSGNDRARYAFAYYLEGIYYWIFTADSYSRVTGSTPSKEKFDYCHMSSIRPRGVYPSDSFIYLCEPVTGKPIQFHARVKKQSAYRDTVDITSAVDSRMIKEMPNVLNRQKVFCAHSLRRQGQKNMIESMVVTIRFNLEGALAGPENPEVEV